MGKSIKFALLFTLMFFVIAFTKSNISNVNINTVPLDTFMGYYFHFGLAKYDNNKYSGKFFVESTASNDSLIQSFIEGSKSKRIRYKSKFKNLYYSLDENKLSEIMDKAICLPELSVLDTLKSSDFDIYNYYENGLPVNPNKECFPPFYKKKIKAQYLYSRIKIIGNYSKDWSLFSFNYIGRYAPYSKDSVYSYTRLYKKPFDNVKIFIPDTSCYFIHPKAVYFN